MTLRLWAIALAMSLIGLAVLAFNCGPFFLLLEGLLLIETAIAALDWLKRYRSHVTRPMILPGQFNQILIFLGAWAFLIGGFVMLWQVSQLLFYGIGAVLVIRNILLVSLANSDEMLIAQVVTVYKVLKKTNPDKEEASKAIHPVRCLNFELNS